MPSPALPLSISIHASPRLGIDCPTSSTFRKATMQSPSPALRLSPHLRLALNPAYELHTRMHLSRLAILPPIQDVVFLHISISNAISVSPPGRSATSPQITKGLRRTGSSKHELAPRMREGVDADARSLSPFAPTPARRASATPSGVASTLNRCTSTIQIELPQPQAPRLRPDNGMRRKRRKQERTIHTTPSSAPRPRFARCLARSARRGVSVHRHFQENPMKGKERRDCAGREMGGRWVGDGERGRDTVMVRASRIATIGTHTDLGGTCRQTRGSAIQAMLTA
ncbi:hypothetical protein DFH06DRAFT_260470 [Mycena polygramma]|nr:hypothetical protein DFH06DRAFT_260470 [Mycena polygramma]